MSQLRAVAISRLADYLDTLLEVHKYDEGEPSNGLMVDAAHPATRIAASVNTSLSSIRGAAATGAQLLLVHHTTWASIDLHLQATKERALRDLGLSLYCAHAALDCHAEFSNSLTLARRLGVRVEGRFAPYRGGFAGVYGKVSGSFDTFVERVRVLLNARVDAWKNNSDFARIAILPGGGPWTTYVEEARSLGCDTYLTGEGTMYTKLFARETGTNLVLATHYATEIFGIRALTEHVADQFGLPLEFVDEDPDIR